MTEERLRSRLETYLAGTATADSARSVGPLTKLTGGWASSLYTFVLTVGDSTDTGAQTMVLKLYAPDEHGRRQATREWRALSQLRRIDYPVPRAVLVEPDARHLGRPFIVMDHVPGRSLWEAFESADSAGRSRLTRAFAERLVALHALDPQLLEPAAPVTPDEYLERELRRLRRDSSNAPHPALAEIVEWLERRKRAVPCERPAILHRDYHPWNVVVDAADRVWVIDWDWQIGDARFDLAWTRTLMQRSGFGDFGDAVRDEYARQSDRAVDDLAYFEVLTTLRWLLNVLPAVETDAVLDAASREDFRAFLVEPVARARTLLKEQTGIDARLRM